MTGEGGRWTYLGFLESGPVLSDPAEDLVEALLCEAALDFGHLVPELVVDEVGDPFFLGESLGGLLQRRTRPVEIVDEVVREAFAGPGCVLGRVHRSGQGGEVVEAGLDDSDGAVALLLEVCELALESTHATEHAVYALEHLCAGGGGGSIGRRGHLAQEGIEVLLEGGSWLEVVLVRLLSLLVRLAEGLERCLGEGGKWGERGMRSASHTRAREGRTRLEAGLF